MGRPLSVGWGRRNLQFSGRLGAMSSEAEKFAPSQTRPCSERPCLHCSLENSGAPDNPPADGAAPETVTPKAGALNSAYLITSSASLPRASATHVKFVASLPAGHIQYV
jgi:hypothetical protein